MRKPQSHKGPVATAAAAPMISVGGRATVAVADGEGGIGRGSTIVDFAVVIAVVVDGVGIDEGDGNGDVVEDCGGGLKTWAE